MESYNFVKNSTRWIKNWYPAIALNVNSEKSYFPLSMKRVLNYCVNSKKNAHTAKVK